MFLCLNRDSNLWCFRSGDHRQHKFLESFRSGMRSSALELLTDRSSQRRAESSWWKRRYVRHAAANFAIGTATFFAGFELLVFFSTDQDISSAFRYTSVHHERTGAAYLPILIPSILVLLLMWKRTYLNEVELRPTLNAVVSTTTTNLFAGTNDPEAEDGWSEDGGSGGQTSARVDSLRSSFSMVNAGGVDQMKEAMHESQSPMKASHFFHGLLVEEELKPCAMAHSLSGLFTRDVALPILQIEFEVRRSSASKLLNMCMPAPRPQVYEWVTGASAVRRSDQRLSQPKTGRRKLDQ